MNFTNYCFLAINIIVIGAALFFFLKDAGKKNENCGNSYSRQELLIFSAILFIALVARLWRFGNVPGGMNQDEAMAAVDAKALSEHATDRFGMHLPAHFTAWGFAQMSVLMSYCMIPFIKLFGLSAVPARLPILLASMGGLVALYFIVRRLLGIRAAQIALTLATFNPWHFMQSRWALDCNMFPHMFLIGLMFLLLSFSFHDSGKGKTLTSSDNKETEPPTSGNDCHVKRRCLYLSMLFFALCMYSYGIAIYTVPLFLIAVCIYLMAKKLLKWFDALISAGIYLLISWPFYLTMAVNTFKWETIETPFVTIPYFPDSVRSRDILFFADNKLEQLLTNIKSTVQIFTKGDNLPWNNIKGFGAINLCFVPFIFLGLFYVIHLFRREQDTEKKTGYFCLLCFFGIGVFSGLVTAEVNINRINILLYALLIFAAIGIYFVYQRRKLLCYPVAAIYLVLSFLFVKAYFTDFKNEISPIFYEDFIYAVQYAGEQAACEYYVITPDTQYQGASNVSEILTLYALDIDDKYYRNLYADENGVKYSEKFFYQNAQEFGTYPGFPVAYVIKAEELLLFPENEYEVKSFGNYYTAIPLLTETLNKHTPVN